MSDFRDESGERVSPGLHKRSAEAGGHPCWNRRNPLQLRGFPVWADRTEGGSLNFVEKLGDHADLRMRID